MATSDYVLSDVTVLDLTTFVTGGFCSLTLANQGAEVIKIERPDDGDGIRNTGPPFVDGESPYFWTVNYGKKSVELNLKTDAGRKALYQLIEEADVFLQNFRPGTAERLGIDYEQVQAKNSSIIYCDISAYGQTGPWSRQPGYDLMIQGRSGIMSVTGEQDGRPVKVGVPITDLLTGMWAALGIVIALRNRDRSGEGEYIDLGMFDATIPWLTKQAGKVFAGDDADRMGTRDPVLAPYQTFATADGYINLAGINSKLWEALCSAIDREDLVDDDRFATNAKRLENVDELQEELEAVLAERTTEQWVDEFEDEGVPAAPVLSVAEALETEQLEARGVIGSIERGDQEIPLIEHPLNFRNATSGFTRAPPRLGEHTQAVLIAAGFSEEDLQEMQDAGAFDT